MKSKRCLVMKGVPGYGHPPLNLAPLGAQEEDIALAVTIPARNAIACIDVGYTPGQNVGFPWEETVHYITILSMMKSMYAVVREDVEKMMNNDSSETFSELQKTVPLAEAIAEIREEYDPEYRCEMIRYRNAVLNYLGTDNSSIFSRREDLETLIQTEKQLLREAADNIIKLYEGPKSEEIKTPLHALTIYTASSYPDHKHFLESCARMSTRWKSIFGQDDIFDALLHNLQRQVPYFPLDHFHFYVAQTTALVRDVIEYYSTFKRKVMLLCMALPTMMSAIDFTMGLFAYLNFTISPEISSNGHIGTRGYFIPRIRKVFTDFGLIKPMLKYYGEDLKCPLCKSYSWPVDPDQTVDDIVASMGGTTGASQITAWYLNRYFVLLDLMAALEDAIVFRNYDCPHCQEVIENLERLDPQLLDLLKKRYVSRNYSRLWSVFEQAGSNISSMSWWYLGQMSRKYLVELQL